MGEQPKNKYKSVRITILTIILVVLIILAFAVSVDDGFYNLPSVPKDMWSHALLQSRSQGVCETMTGEVLVTVVFVNDGESSWTADTMENAKKELEEAISILTAEAAGYGAWLHISSNYVQSSTDAVLGMQESEGWADSVLQNAGLPDIYEVCESLEDSYDVKEAPVLFCVNRSGRSFVAQQDFYKGLEYGVIYEGESAAFRHELSHIFGAEDYYHPDTIKDIADNYFPDSIMLEASDEHVTDSLTAYLIGWTDEISGEALNFLKETSGTTLKSIEEGKETELYTGYATHRFEYGTYTGDLVDGTCQGKGKMIWNDGTVYEGDWVCSVRSGQGTCHFTDGTVYSGAWENDRMNGRGTMTFTDGAVYTGEWKNGVMSGRGTCTYPNGDVYTGGWENGARQGQGTYTYHNGAIYTGNWKDGAQHGQGTMTYPNGEIYSGIWENNQFVR